MEKDLNTALHAITKTSKVDNVDNLNRTVLMKWNKDPLAVTVTSNIHYTNPYCTFISIYRNLHSPIPLHEFLTPTNSTILLSAISYIHYISYIRKTGRDYLN